MNSEYLNWKNKSTARRALLADAQARHSKAKAELARARQKDIHPRDEYVRAESAAAKTVTLRKQQLATANRKVLEFRPLDTIVSFDGVPVPRGQAIAFQYARDHDVIFHLNSGNREDPVISAFNKKHGTNLHSQQYLFDHRNDPGFNPANPPGRSTHEQRSDGVAYPGPVGRRLEWWQQGIDVLNAPALMAFLNSHGFHVRRPYSSPSEAHHLNFTQNPTRRVRAILAAK